MIFRPLPPQRFSGSLATVSTALCHLAVPEADAEALAGSVTRGGRRLCASRGAPPTGAVLLSCWRARDPMPQHRRPAALLVTRSPAARPCNTSSALPQTRGWQPAPIASLVCGPLQLPRLAAAAAAGRRLTRHITARAGFGVRGCPRGRARGAAAPRVFRCRRWRARAIQVVTTARRCRLSDTVHLS